MSRRHTAARSPVRQALFALTVLTVSGGAAAGQAFTSGDRAVPLVELYTSEGCSSCPPAERWLSRLADEPGLWERFVPVAFHVDYWNYLGWNDRFANRAHSERQRRYIEQGAARVVYTPGVFRAGSEWLGWRSGQRLAAAAKPVGRLTVEVENGRTIIRYVPAAPTSAPLDVSIALLGMGLETEVLAGENRGRRLAHDFVVLDHRVVQLDRERAEYRAESELETPAEPAKAYALAVWVNARGAQQPLQATGGLLESTDF